MSASSGQRRGGLTLLSLIYILCLYHTKPIHTFYYKVPTQTLFKFANSVLIADNSENNFLLLPDGKLGRHERESVIFTTQNISTLFNTKNPSILFKHNHKLLYQKTAQAFYNIFPYTRSNKLIRSEKRI